MSTRLARLRHSAVIYSGALLCGAIGYLINLPLPWMIGAMFFAAAMRLSDRPVEVPAMTRPIGQMIVAASVGLSFTPDAVATVASMFVPMIAAAVLTIHAGFLVATVLMRLAHLDVVSATLCAMPIGPVESASLAAHHGVSEGPIVFAQTLRVMLLVICIPPLLVYSSDATHDPMAVLRNLPWTVPGAILLASVSLLGAVAAKVLQLGNPYFIGALGGAAVASALSLPATPFPYPALVVAQIFLGVWLGAVLDRRLLHNATGFIRAVFISAVLLILLCAALGLALTWFTDERWQVMILATAPGSVTEMTLTAKVLQDGITVVTAFHLVRIFIILPLAPLLISLTARVAKAWGP